MSLLLFDLQSDAEGTGIIMVQNSILDWLLETSDPAVRAATLTSLCQKSENDPEVLTTRKAMMASVPIAKILSLQNPDGSWGLEERFYDDKYTGSVWTLLTLAELGADPEDPRIHRACEFILGHSQDPDEYGFSMRQSAKTHAGLPGYVIPCLTGNLVYALIRFGYLQDERIQNAIAWILKYQQADDGSLHGPQDPIVKRLEPCFGRHTCHMGVAKALKALAAIPGGLRTPAVTAKIGELAEYFLIHHLYRKSHDLAQISKPGWLHFGFPLMYQTDILELLEIFATLHLRDPRLDDAIAVVAGKQDAEGRWLLENSYNGKMLIRIEQKGTPSKWITLKALNVLREYRPDAIR